jgi:hypothetical protein
MIAPRAGATRIKRNGVVRRNAKFRFRAKTTRLRIEPVVYAHGVSATHSSPTIQ